MKRLSAGLWACLLLPLISLSPTVHAQTSQARSAGTFYDITREVTLRGTVASVGNSGGIIPGGRLLMTTSSGAVEVNLGRFGLRGKGALEVAEGDQVEVTGMMKTLGANQVFVARTVKVGEQVYIMRNQYGIPVSPQARDRAAQPGEKL